MNEGDDRDVKPFQPNSETTPPPYVGIAQPPPGHSAASSGGPTLSYPFTEGYQPAPANLDRNTTVTVVTTQPTSATRLPPPPTTWIAWSIFSCLCCAWPCGLVAIMYSMKSSEHYSGGQYDSAVSASRTALIWNVVSTVVGICAYIAAGIIIGIRLGSAGDASTTNLPY